MCFPPHQQQHKAMSSRQHQDTNFSKLQSDFSLQCTILKEAPNIADWIVRIRQIKPSGPIYVIIYKYTNDGGADVDAYLLESSDIDWPGTKNDAGYRNRYFHKSSSDSNIWILKLDYRYDVLVIKSLVKNKNLI